MNAQRSAALALLVIAIAYTALAAGIEEAFASPFALGPRAFPLIVGASGVLLSLVLLCSPTTATGPSPTPLLAGDWRRVLALCALALLYALALPRAGFGLSTIAYLAASFRLLGERRAVTLVVLPIAVAAIALATMRGFLGVHLPEPLLEGLLGARR
jgi:putative tricarboxylic transport membrane protein